MEQLRQCRSLCLRLLCFLLCCISVVEGRASPVEISAHPRNHRTRFDARQSGFEGSSGARCCSRWRNQRQRRRKHGEQQSGTAGRTALFGSEHDGCDCCNSCSNHRGSDCRSSDSEPSCRTPSRCTFFLCRCCCLCDVDCSPLTVPSLLVRVHSEQLAHTRYQHCSCKLGIELERIVLHFPHCTALLCSSDRGGRWSSGWIQRSGAASSDATLAHERCFSAVSWVESTETHLRRERGRGCIFVHRCCCTFCILVHSGCSTSSCCWRSRSSCGSRCRSLVAVSSGQSSAHNVARSARQSSNRCCSAQSRPTCALIMSALSSLNSNLLFPMLGSRTHNSREQISNSSS